MKGLPPSMRSVLFIFLLGVRVLYHVWGESAKVSVVQSQLAVGKGILTYSASLAQRKLTLKLW